MQHSSYRRQLRAALARSPALDRSIRRLRRSDAVAALQQQVVALRSEVGALDGRMAALSWEADTLRAELEAARAAAAAAPDPSVATIPVPPSVAPFLTDSPPGHFYSPVPDLDDIEAQADRLFATDRPLPGVELREDEQLALFRRLAALARETSFEAVPGGRTRYGLGNTNYGVGDASMLTAMLRHLRPRRYLEVGSGFTTALALDVNDAYLGGELEVTAVEPYPSLLRSVTRPGDRIEVLDRPVQFVPLERFASLEAGDVLFVDCSHVLKTGSDAQFLYTTVLPVLAPGVYVHVHDIFWPFEYLRHWVEGGRAWNECYLLHAFLLFNEAFEIVLWNHFLYVRHEALIAEELPAMLENPGGALWMRRRASGSGTGGTGDGGTGRPARGEG